MAKITITEALQEIKTINSRLEKKRVGIHPYLARDVRIRDPFESSGGCAKYVREERQSITDLEKRLVSIRTAIQRSNLDSPLTILDVTQSVAEWLVWRREVSPGSSAFLQRLSQGMQSARAQIQQKGGKVTSGLSASSAEVNLTADAPPEVVINVDEKALLAEIDSMQNTLGILDGKLSLFNATTVIDV